MTHPWTRVGAEGVAGPAGPPAPGAIRRWWLGARPRTLPAAVVPVLVGTAAAHPRHPGTWSQVAVASLTGGVHGGGPRIDPWWCAIGALVVALAVQIGTNYANDYADGIRGTDDARVGPVRLVASGLATPGAVRRAALCSFGVAAVVGLGLAWATSWWVLPVGAACLLAGWFYTGGPRPYGYAGLGEVFVFVFFGLVATVGTFFVETVRIDVPIVWFAAVLVGLLATALLLANNLRDIATDRETGKRTLAVRIGRTRRGPVLRRVHRAAVRRGGRVGDPRGGGSDRVRHQLRGRSYHCLRCRWSWSHCASPGATPRVGRSCRSLRPPPACSSSSGSCSRSPSGCGSGDRGLPGLLRAAQARFSPGCRR